MDKLLLLWIMALSFSKSALATTYYVSPSGHDRHPGTSPEKPWQSIIQLNRNNFQAGDRILFQAGETFYGTLKFDPLDQTSTSKPIVIGSYGRGRATIHSDEGDGIFIYNSGGYRIENLKVSGGTAPRTSGIHFYSDLASQTKLNYIRIVDVDVSGFSDAGIKIGAWNRSKSGFRDVQIVRANVHNNRDLGILVYGFFDRHSREYSNQHIYIGYSKSYDNPGMLDKGIHSGSGIIIGDTDRAIIEHCEAFNNGSLNNYPKGGPIGIWAWDARAVTLQYNESHHNHSQTIDGGGFDLDGGVTDSVMQYNYSHDNDGAGYLIAQFPGARPLRNNIIRYNISENDARNDLQHSPIHLWNGGSGIQRQKVYNNTLLLPERSTNSLKPIRLDGPQIQAEIYNNITITNREPDKKAKTTDPADPPPSPQ
jgi:hypothetical protein